MATRINSEGYFLDINGRIKDPSQKDHLAWKAKLNDAWARNNNGAPPPDQTIMVVENGDCQWTIAEDAGANPVTTAYEMNKQFNDADLINPNDIVFVSKSTEYAHSDGANAKDNTDIVADNTFHHTATASLGNGDFATVRGDLDAYLDTIPPVDNIANPTVQSPGFHYQAVHNLLLFPSWGGLGDEGHYGRQLVAEEYLKKFPVASQQGSGMMDRQTAANELKVSLGLATKSVNEQGQTEYKDKTADEIKADKANIAKEAGLEGDELNDSVKVDNAVKEKINLLSVINSAYSNVKTD